MDVHFYEVTHLLTARALSIWAMSSRIRLICSNPSLESTQTCPQNVTSKHIRHLRSPACQGQACRPARCSLWCRGYSWKWPTWPSIFPSLQTAEHVFVHVYYEGFVHYNLIITCLCLQNPTDILSYSRKKYSCIWACKTRLIYFFNVLIVGDFKKENNTATTLSSYSL